MLLEPRPGDILVLGKGDMVQGVEGSVSGLTGLGLDALMAKIGESLSGRVASAGVMTRERHRIAMRNAIASMESARIEVKSVAPRPEFVAADLWRAIRGLDMLVGRADVENLLDEIFASFCIGK